MDAGIERTYAEKLAIKATIVARKPDRLSQLQAAAMTSTGMTAIWDTEDTAQLRVGENFVSKVRGGRRRFRDPMAKYLGAKVVTMTNAANVDYVRGPGADRVVDYNAADFHQVWAASAPDGFRQPRSDVAALRPAVWRDRAHVERIVALLDADAVSPPPSAIRSRKAHRVSEARHPRDKLVPAIR